MKWVFTKHYEVVLNGLQGNKNRALQFAKQLLTISKSTSLDLTWPKFYNTSKSCIDDKMSEKRLRRSAKMAEIWREKIVQNWI